MANKIIKRPNRGRKPNRNTPIRNVPKRNPKNIIPARKRPFSPIQPPPPPGG